MNTVTLWASINTRETPHLKATILTGDLFRFACGRCAHETFLAFDLLYHDPDLRLMIWLKYPDEGGESQPDERTDEILEVLGGGYRYRTVTSVEELIEKIRIFEDGYDDIAIEVLKTAISANREIDLTAPLYYEKTRRRIFGSPHVQFAERTAGGGYIKHEYSVADLKKIEQQLPRLRDTSTAGDDRWKRIDRNYALEFLQSTGSIEQRYRVLVKGPTGSVEEQYWDLTEEQVEQFVDQEGTAYAMYHLDRGERRYSLLRRAVWMNLDRVLAAMMDKTLSDEDRKRILAKCGAVRGASFMIVNSAGRSGALEMRRSALQ